MELLLNSVWAMLGLLSICLWLRTEKRTRAERLLPFVALVMVILILFPVISVSDDLWALQNPAEVDSSQRRAHAVADMQSTTAVVAILPMPVSSLQAAVEHRLATQIDLAAQIPDRPALSSIDSRPPPVA